MLQLSKEVKRMNSISMELHEEQVTELNYKIEKLEDENYLLQDELDDTISEYEEEIDELKGEIEELKEEIKQLKENN